MTTLRNLLHSFIPSSVISIWVWVPCVPRPGSTKPAPHLFLLVAGTGQHRLFPASWYALPHPLQNRVPRGAGRSPVALCCEPVSAAASVGAGRSPLGSSTRGGSRDKSFCPCHKTGGNTEFSPVFFLPVLHGFGVRFGSDSGFSHLVLPVLNRSHPLQHPKRTRFRPFRTISGAFRCFCSLLTCKIFVLVFVHTAA